MPVWTDFLPAALAQGAILVAALVALLRLRDVRLALLGVSGGSLLVYAALVEPRLLTIERVEIESPEWTAPPITIAALADTHVPSAHMSADRVARIVAATNELKPDLVALLGDYVAGSRPAERRHARENAAIADGLAAFAALRAPAGVFAVLGENDCYTDCEGFRDALERGGATVLWNEAAFAEHRGSRLLVLGAGDDDTGDSDPAAALVDAPLLPSIGLTHSPDNFPDFPAPPRGPVVVLAGQTHCGQVRLPLIGAIKVPSIYGRRYACGLVVETDARGVRRLVVGAGLGVSVLPVRFGAAPEILLVIIRGPR